MFVYQADTYCDACGHALREELAAGGYAPADPDDERSYDSDDFPKYAAEEATDSPDHCASADTCLEPIDLQAYGLPADGLLIGAESRRIGALLSDGLTDEGAAYVAQAIEERASHNSTVYQNALYRLWAETFAEELSAV